ncbi:hypothetical protein [Burkholderia glumae]|uniref:hypothetical protein n=1 Tax=Burkholderia glumae TaxID=337 RepID=UPI002150E9CB|nr:hypothetical protein [Burkholderia glumae]
MSEWDAGDRTIRVPVELQAADDSAALDGLAVRVVPAMSARRAFLPDGQRYPHDDPARGRVMRIRKRTPVIGVNLANTEQLAPEFSARMLLTVFDAPLFIRRNFVDITGSITAALMLTYAVDLYSSHEPVVTPDTEAGSS